LQHYASSIISSGFDNAEPCAFRQCDSSTLSTLSTLSTDRKGSRANKATRYLHCTPTIATPTANGLGKKTGRAVSYGPNDRGCVGILALQSHINSATDTTNATSATHCNTCKSAY
jgi:hypothetical protein